MIQFVVPCTSQKAAAVALQARHDEPAAAPTEEDIALGKALLMYLAPSTPKEIILAVALQKLHDLEASPDMVKLNTEAQGWKCVTCHASPGLMAFTGVAAEHEQGETLR